MPPMQVGEYDLTVTNPDGEVVTLRRALLVRVRPSQAIRCDPVTVYFEFDRDTVTAQGRDALDTVAPCLAEVQGRVRLEGHTDERGSTDYNLALGQRRADAVHRYLVGQAVPLNRLRTVSYGEERPVDPASNERAWALNRRVEVVVEDR
ncbi:MAG: peptidoglycan-associated lipoprotein [Deltaproteobacteria bacterium]|nr:MAG: peptidoglycan-associated lipoprotein [Deltaproteobacteria bacterium]